MWLISVIIIPKMNKNIKINRPKLDQNDPHDESEPSSEVSQRRIRAILGALISEKSLANSAASTIPERREKLTLLVMIANEIVIIAGKSIIHELSMIAPNQNF